MLQNVLNLYMISLFNSFLQHRSFNMDIPQNFVQNKRRMFTEVPPLTILRSSGGNEVQMEDGCVTMFLKILVKFALETNCKRFI